ncbi:hypothetical protein ACQ4PT_023367 [Festuca glaucescens]
MAGSTTGAVFLALIIALLVVIIILLGVCWKFLGPGIMRRLLRPRRCPSELPQYFSGNMSGNLRTITYFDYAALKRATRDFHQKNQLGRGGFGPVYLAWRLYEQNKILELVDAKVQAGEGFEEKEVMQVCQIALLCVQPYPESRPAMSEAVRMLTMKTDQTIPPPVKPAFLDRKNLNRENKDADTSTMEMMRSPASYWMMTPSPAVDRPYDMSFGK